MQKFLLIIEFLLIAKIIECKSFPINNNCEWPEDCYVNLKLTKSCQIESVTIDKASEKVKNVDELVIRKLEYPTQCYAVADKSTIRCYSRCSSILPSSDVDENHIINYNQFIIDRFISDHAMSYIFDARLDKIGWLTKDKNRTAERNYFNDCAKDAFRNSTGIPSRNVVKAPVKVQLDCENWRNEYCLITIKYTSNGLNAIESTTGPTDIKMDEFFKVNTHSCRIFQEAVECICRRTNERCQSLDYLTETIYLLGRDQNMRGKYVDPKNRTEHNENIPMVLDMLQKFRISYPKDMYGSSKLDCSTDSACGGFCALTFEIDAECRSVHQSSSDFHRNVISVHRFIDLDKLGSIALELELNFKLQLKVYCKMRCIVDDLLYARIMNALHRQIADNADRILFGGRIASADKNKHVACAYYSFRHELLRNMYGKYDEANVLENLKFRESWKTNSKISLIVSTILTALFILLMISIIVTGLISNFRRQTPKQPITFNARKSTIIARRKKDVNNSKDKTGDFYECVTKTSAVNNTDLASVLEDAKSRD